MLLLARLIILSRRGPAFPYGWKRDFEYIICSLLPAVARSSIMSHVSVVP